VSGDALVSAKDCKRLQKTAKDCKRLQKTAKEGIAVDQSSCNGISAFSFPAVRLPAIARSPITTTTSVLTSHRGNFHVKVECGDKTKEYM
jgi:hypothetical protein